MRSPRDLSALEQFREYWVKCVQLLGMMREDEFDGAVGLVSEDLNLYREYRRQNQPPLPLDNALDEVKFELDQISDGQISNLIDNHLLDNVGDLLEAELLNNADTRSTLRENIDPSEPFESLGNFQGTFEGQQYNLGVDYRGLQNREGADTRFTQMMESGRSHMEVEAGPSQIQHLDSLENLSPIVSAPINLGSTSQTMLLPKSGGRGGKWMEAADAKGWKKVEVSGSPVTTCGQARRERNLKAFENKGSLAAERRAKETERRSKEMERRQVAMERKNALASARQSGTAGYPSSRSKGKDIKAMKSEFLNRDTEASTGSTGSVIQQLETSIEKMENSGVGTEDVFYKQLQRNHRLLVNHQLREAPAEPNWQARNVRAKSVADARSQSSTAYSAKERGIILKEIFRWSRII